MTPFRIPVPAALVAILALFAYASTAGFAPVPTALALAALPAVLWRGTLPLPRSLMLPAALVLGLLVFSNQTELRRASTFVLPSGYPAGLMISGFVLMFLYRRNEPREGLFLLFLSSLLLMDAGMTTEVWPYTLFLVGTGICLSMALRSWMADGRPVPGWDRVSLVAVAALVPVALLSVTSAVTLKWSESRVNMALRIIDPGVGGSVSFASRTSLQSMLNMRSERVLARVRSKAPAPYLVARSYVTYQNNIWEAPAGGGDVRPMARGDLSPALQGALPTTGNVFPGPSLQGAAGGLPAAWLPATVDQVDLSGDSLNVFASRDTVLMGARLDGLARDSAGSLFPQPLGQPVKGTIWLARGAHGAVPLSETEAMLEACRRIPETVRSYAAPLAETAVQGCSSDEQKASALEAFMRKEYTYQLGCAMRDSDPLREFLTRKTPAHCEFFATGMVAMLRCQGIPARYVTGFLVAEYNAVGGYYVIRDLHAHGWVEAWFPRRGWVSYDPTPPDALGSSRPDRLRQWVDLFAYFIERCRNFMAGLSFRSLLSLAVDGITFVGRWLIEQPWRIGLLLLLFAIETLFRRPDAVGRRWWKSLRGRTVQEEGNPEVARLQALLHRLDTWLARRGFERPLHLTLLEWAARLEEGALDAEAERGRRAVDAQDVASLARFSREYVRARYASKTPPPEVVAGLEKLVEGLERQREQERARR